jgi:hypothetical protein
MNAKKVNWVFLALIAMLGLMFTAHKLTPPPKARAQRIHAVNHLANITITLPSTNTLSVPNSIK